MYVILSKLEKLSIADVPTSAPKPNSKAKKENQLAFVPES